MSCRRCASLVLAVVASACAASANTLLGQDGTAAAATRGNASLIVRAELEQAAGQTALQVVRSLRGRWLQPVRSASFNFAPAYARVVVDRIPRGELQELRLMVVDDIETMRRFSPSEATTRHGTGYAGGVIEVTTRGRAQDRVPAPRLVGDMIPAAAQGRPPVAGDLLRVECFSPQDQEGRIAEGFFEGAGGGELLLSVGLQSQRVAVPVVNVTRVEVRGSRTRKGVGGLIGTLLGAAAGALIGDSQFAEKGTFNRPNTPQPVTGGRRLRVSHATRRIYIGAGVVLGAFSGLIVGNIIGSQIKTDVWLDAPQDWVVQYSESGSTTPEGSARAMGCLGLGPF